MKDRDEPGVPLAHYVDHHPRIGVRIICQACATSRDVPMAAMVAELERRGLDARATGIRTIAKLFTTPCAACGKRAWETRPAF